MNQDNKIFIDQFGTKWFGCRLVGKPVRVEPGDYVFFNQEKGFAFCPPHVVNELYWVDDGSGEMILDYDAPDIKKPKGIELIDEAFKE